MVILIIRTVYRQIAIARFGLLKKDPGMDKRECPGRIKCYEVIFG